MAYEAREQNSDDFLFKTAKEAAGFATRVGMTVPDFIKLYLDNIYVSEQEAWHTAVRFKAKIVDVTTERTGKKGSRGLFLEKAIIHYQTGTNGEKSHTAAINGLLAPGYRTKDIFDKAKQAIGKEVLLYRGYDKQKYVAIIDLDILEIE